MPAPNVDMSTFNPNDPNNQTNVNPTTSNSGE